MRHLLGYPSISTTPWQCCHQQQPRLILPPLTCRLPIPPPALSVTLLLFPLVDADIAIMMVPHIIMEEVLQAGVVYKKRGGGEGGGDLVVLKEATTGGQAIKWYYNQ